MPTKQEREAGRPRWQAMSTTERFTEVAKNTWYTLTDPDYGTGLLIAAFLAAFGVGIADALAFNPWVGHLGTVMAVVAVALFVGGFIYNWSYPLDVLVSGPGGFGVVAGTVATLLVVLGLALLSLAILGTVAAFAALIVGGWWVISVIRHA